MIVTAMVAGPVRSGDWAAGVLYICTLFPRAIR